MPAVNPIAASQRKGSGCVGPTDEAEYIAAPPGIPQIPKDCIQYGNPQVWGGRSLLAGYLQIKY